MYGLFFEDINFAANGGLYAKLVKNRSFDFPQNLMGWHVFIEQSFFEITFFAGMFCPVRVSVMMMSAVSSSRENW
jgi:hypothetical protein